MSQTTIDILIGSLTFFATCLVNAFVLGLFLGGIKSDVRAVADRLLRIEGAFTLTPTNITIQSPERTVSHDSS